MNFGLIFNLLLAAITVAVYTGFYFTDPDAGMFHVLVKWAARIIIPLLVLGYVLIYKKVKKGTIPGMAIWGSLFVIVFTILAFFPVIFHIHEKKSMGNLSQYHPYLQLRPAPLKVRPKDKNGRQTLRIFCLGGSTTQFTDKKGIGWPSRLEGILSKKHPHLDIQVYNAGRQWYSSQHTLINYVLNVRKFKPDIVIVMHAINDLLHNADFSALSIGDFKSDYSHFLGPTYRMIKRKTFWSSVFSIFKKVWFFKKKEIVDTDIFPGLDSFKYNLNALIKLAKNDNTQVILMSQPHLLKDQMTDQESKSLLMVNYEAVGETKRWNSRTALSGMNQYNLATKSVARSNNVHLIDLEKALPKTLEYFNDEVHYTDRSFDLLADFIADQVIQ